MSFEFARKSGWRAMPIEALVLGLGRDDAVPGMPRGKTGASAGTGASARGEGKGEGAGVCGRGSGAAMGSTRVGFTPCERNPTKAED